MCIYINEARMYANVCVYISMSISNLLVGGEGREQFFQGNRVHIYLYIQGFIQGSDVIIQECVTRL